MNEALQFGNHPDADSIGAFVEHALPAHEREQVLAHLAACAECRAIVAASLPPVEESAPARPVSDRKPWWSGWRLAWPATALASALILFAIYFHRPARTPRIPAGDQIAENRPETSPALDRQTPPTTAAPAVKKPTAAPDVTGHGMGARAALQPPSSNTAPAAGDLSVADVSVTGRNAAPIGQTPPPAAAPEFPTLKSQVRLGASSAGATSGGMGAGLSVVQSADAKTAPQAATASQPSAAPALLQSDAAAPNAVVAPNQAPEAAEVINSSSAIRPESANPNALPVTPDASVTLDEERITETMHPLPSRLAVLSMAAEGSRILAIDTSNSVFISKDDGIHWKRIPAPWQGKAVNAVRVNYQPTNPTVVSRENAISTRGFSAGMAPQAGALNGAIDAQMSPPASATGASLIGTVTDFTGAVIPRASITLTDIATNISRAAQTDSAGRYRFDSIPPGSYRLDASASGFVKLTRTVDVGNSAQPTVVDLKLNVGAQTQTVTVQAAAGLETETTNLDAGSTRLKERPLKKAKAAATVPAAAPAVFQITTDTGEHWSSADGLNWKRQ